MNNSENGKFPAFASATAGRTVSRGLTKREYFAGLALQGILASDPGFNTGPLPGDVGYPSAEGIAQIAVDFADALIKELEKGVPA